MTTHTRLDEIEAALKNALDEVREMRQRLLEPKPTEVGLRVFPDWRDSLKELLLRFHRGSLTDAGEVELLRELIQNETRLQLFPAEVQVLLLAFAVARLRHHQLKGLPDTIAVPLVKMVGEYARRTQVGYVYGAGRADDAKFGSWEKDARVKMERLSTFAGLTRSTPTVEQLLDRIRESIQSSAPFSEIEVHLFSALDQGVHSEDVRLVKMMAPFLGELGSRARFKTLRKAIRVADEERQIEEAQEPSTLIPSDWPWLDFTKGKRGIILGGDSREESRVRIERAFQFAQLDWEGTEGKSMNAQRVRDRVLAKTVDLVILLRFIGHDIDKLVLPACRSTKTPFIFLSGGYGIKSIQQEVERTIPIPSHRPSK